MYVNMLSNIHQTNVKSEIDQLKNTGIYSISAAPYGRLEWWSKKG